MAVTGTTWSNKGLVSTTAELRTLGGQISAAIASAGMVKTTDTGQVDWTTITWITGVQTWGYEVWRFNDTLQATKPVFVKIVYSQPTTNYLNMTAQVGTATDGAGNLTSAPNTNTSVTAANDICKAATIGNSAVKPWYVYGDGSSLIIASTPEHMVSGTTGYGGLFILERARDVDGTPLGDGVCIYWASGSVATTTVQSLLIHNLAPQIGSAASQGSLPAFSGQPSSFVLGTNMYVLPWFTGYTPRLGAPSKMVVGILKSDMAGGNTFPLTHYGAAGTFVAVSPSGAYIFGPSGGSNLLGLGIRVA